MTLLVKTLKVSIWGEIVVLIILLVSAEEMNVVGCECYGYLVSVTRPREERISYSVLKSPKTARRPAQQRASLGCSPARRWLHTSRPRL